MQVTFSTSRVLVPLAVALATLVAVAGCSKEPAPPSADDVKAFAGDPAKKAQMGAAIREQAMKGADQAQAQAQAKAVANRPASAR